jgi:hypothetical protein
MMRSMQLSTAHIGRRLTGMAMTSVTEVLIGVEAAVVGASEVVEGISDAIEGFEGEQRVCFIVKSLLLN